MRQLLVFLFFLTGSTFLHSQAFDFWGDLQAGPYPVGFSVENHYDTGRNFRQLKNQDTLSIHRPIQLASHGFVVATMPAIGSQSWAKDRRFLSKATMEKSTACRKRCRKTIPCPFCPTATNISCA